MSRFIDLLRPPHTFAVLAIRVPKSGTVRIPHRGYPHEFASIPNGWREISGLASEYVVVPIVTRPVDPWDTGREPSAT
jgi:hypothetical protein